MIFSASLIIQLNIARHKAKEKLEDGRLQTLVLEKHQFTWYKKNKEISIEGMLFDVKSFSVNNGKYEFKGLYDHDETALHQKLNKNLKERTNLFLTGIFQLLFSSQSSYYPEIAPADRTARVHFPLILPHTSFPYKDILTPPPQSVRS